MCSYEHHSEEFVVMYGFRSLFCDFCESVTSFQGLEESNLLSLLWSITGHALIRRRIQKCYLEYNAIHTLTEENMKESLWFL